jgi:putative transposase
MLPGYAYHLTHRCHNQAWLLKRAVDRNEYRSRLREALRGSGVALLAYCVTSNHVHLLTTARQPDAIPTLMQKVQGEYAEWYNRRRGRTGAYWDGRYHCTMIESGRHLWNCATYIDLNMVRAGTVRHPREWRWCSFDELSGRRSRYRLLDQDVVAEYLAGGSGAFLASDYEAAMAEALSRGGLGREPAWTESIGVGSQAFVDEIAGQTRGRVRLEINESPGGSWTVREEAGEYGRKGRAVLEAPTTPYKGFHGPKKGF